MPGLSGKQLIILADDALFHFAVRECDWMLIDICPPLGQIFPLLVNYVSPPLAHWQSTDVGPPDSPTLGQRRAVVGPTLAHRRLTDVCPPLGQWWATDGVNWPTGQPTVGPTASANVGPTKVATKKVATKCQDIYRSWMIYLQNWVTELGDR